MPNIITLTLRAQTWFVPIVNSMATLNLRSPQSYVVNGNYQIPSRQKSIFVAGVAQFMALSSADLTAMGFADAYYVLTVDGRSHTFWLAAPGEAIYDGDPDNPGNVVGDLARLIELVPVNGGSEPPPGASVSQTVLAQLAGLAAQIAAINTGGAVDKTYRHVQSSASSEWSIAHNMGKVPSVVITDSTGSVVIGDVQHDSNAQCVAIFSAPFAGEANCN